MFGMVCVYWSDIGKFALQSNMHFRDVLVDGPMILIFNLNVITLNVNIYAPVTVLTMHVSLHQQEAKREPSICSAPEDCLPFPSAGQPNQHT